MAKKRKSASRNSAARSEASETETPNWLSAKIDSVLIEGELQEPRGIAQVAEHLATMPSQPLPDDLLAVLREWIAKHHGHKVIQERRGAPDSPLRRWYPLIDRLVQLGLSITDACAKVQEHAGLKDNLESMNRQYRRDRNIEAKLSNDVAEAWQVRNEEEFAKALSALAERTIKGD